jgi:membrane glycosyltransferase
MRTGLKLPKFKRGSGPKEWLLFGLSIACSIFFIWAGSKIIALSGSLTSQDLVILGIVEVIGGIILAGSYYHWSIGFTVVLLGFYSFARADYIIKKPFLGYILALASWVASALLIYATYPSREANKPKE